MDEKHPEIFDNRPRRHKSKDNPYTINSVGANTDNPRYYVSFIDSEGNQVCIKIEKQLFDALNQFELDDVSYINERKRHYALKDQDGEPIDITILTDQNTIEEIIQQKNEEEQLHRAIEMLPEKMRLRIKLYYFEGKTYDEIAIIEGCSKVAIKYSIDLAKRRLSEILKNN